MTDVTPYGPTSLNIDGPHLWTGGEGLAPDDRQMRNWPLPEVDLAVEVTDADFVKGRPYPPQRAQRRAERLDAFHALYRGDFSYFAAERAAITVATNYFRLVCRETSRIVVHGLDESEMDASDAVTAAAIDFIRYGQTFPTLIDGDPRTFDARHCWYDADGESLWVVDPYTSLDSPNGDNDRATVYRIYDDGSAVVFDQGLRYGRWTGDRSQVEELAAGWDSASASPEQNGWGTDSFTDLIPLVMETAFLDTQSGENIRFFSSPLRVVPLANKQLGEILTGHAASQNELGHDHAQALVSSSFVRHKNLLVPSGTHAPTQIGGNLDLTSSIEQASNIRDRLRLMTAIPTVVASQGTGAPSGAAFRQEYLLLFVQVDEIVTRLRRAFSALYGRDFIIETPFEDAPTPDAGVTEGDRTGQLGSDGGSEGGGNAAA